MVIKSPTINPIVIVDYQRSGTSLLRKILGNHPDMLEHPDEPQFFLVLYHRFGHYIRDIESALSYVSSHPYFPKSLRPGSLISALRGIRSLFLQEFVNVYIQTWGGNELKTKRPIYKHPELVFHLDLVINLFPNATILNIVRDPRGNAASQQNRWPQFSIWENAMLWREAGSSARKWGQKTKNQYQEIKIENLVLNPHETIRALCSELGLQFSEHLLTFELEITTYSPLSPPKKTIFKSIDPSQVDLWQSSLSASEIYFIETCCRKEMSWWDYKALQHQIKSRGRKLKSEVRSFAGGRELSLRSHEILPC